jgi:hypothetical protein
MNPNLTANLRADRELRAEIREEQLEQISQDLERALKALKWAKKEADTAKLSETHSASYTAICDALTNTQEAIDRLNDTPDH